MRDRLRERFARAIDTRESTGLKDLMRTDIDFRAMTSTYGKGHR